MAAKITFFSVGCGDMTLIRLADFNVTTILIDTNIRVAADDPSDSTPDVATALRKRLLKDEKGRPESPRVCRRLTFLRELAYEKETWIFPRNA